MDKENDEGDSVRGGGGIVGSYLYSFLSMLYSYSDFLDVDADDDIVSLVIRNGDGDGNVVGHSLHLVLAVSYLPFDVLIVGFDNDIV